jgi:hypothetical protein
MTNTRLLRHCVSRNDEIMMCHSECSEESSSSGSQLADPSQKMLRMTKRTWSCRSDGLNCFVKSARVRTAEPCKRARITPTERNKASSEVQGEDSYSLVLRSASTLGSHSKFEMTKNV